MASFSAIIYLARTEDGRCPMLESVLFDPAARWLAVSLRRAGADRFLVICHPDDRAAVEPCFPDGTCFAPLGQEEAPLADFLSGSGRAVVFTQPVFLMEEFIPRLSAGQTAPDQTELDFLSQAGQGGSTGIFELTDLARTGIATGGKLAVALRAGCPEYTGYTVLPVTPLMLTHQLPVAAREQMVWRLSDEGVRFLAPDQAYLSPQVQVGRGTVILPGTILKGNTVIGENCTIGPNSMITDCTIGNAVTVNASQLLESTVEDETIVGPFAYVRPHCHVGKGVKVGDFVELKNSTIGDGTKISHLTYVGDTDAGSHINFGCGTVTVNYDGKHKFRTTIGDGAFIGCNTNLVAPVTVGEGAYTAAGSTITVDVPADALSIARARQVNKDGWAKDRREKD